MSVAAGQGRPSRWEPSLNGQADRQEWDQQASRRSKGCAHSLIMHMDRLVRSIGVSIVSQGHPASLDWLSSTSCAIIPLAWSGRYVISAVWLNVDSTNAAS